MKYWESSLTSSAAPVGRGAIAVPSRATAGAEISLLAERPRYRLRFHPHSNCWKLQLQPPADDPQYGSILLWVDKDSGTLMRMEGYDSAGKLIKRFEVVSAQKIEDRWYLKQMRVEQIDPKSNKVTARTYLEINK